MTDLAEATLEELREALAPEIAANAAFDGWSRTAVDAAAGARGVDVDVARLAFGDTPVKLIDAWFASVDAAMLALLPRERLATMKVRERIKALVEARLTILAPNREALRRALTVLAMPQNLVAAARLGWRSADIMWRAAGDTAADYNHYTKRTILAGVYAATATVFLNDESEGHVETRAFLDRRIDGIMRFERAKAGFLARVEHRPSLTRFIGRLRYPTV
jgi:ubiquinone biosynthesis protein COQ9